MNRTLTLHEVSQLKRTMDNSINDAIREFEAKTGMSVNEVQLDRVRKNELGRPDSGSVLARVSTQIELQL